MSQLQILLFTIILAIAAPELDDNLQVLSLSPARLQVKYHTGAGKGIHVMSEVNQQDNYIDISTLSGEKIVSAQFSTSEPAALWRIMGNNVFRVGHQAQVVSSDTTIVREELRHVKMLSHIQTTEDIKATLWSAYAEFFNHPENHLDSIVELSRILGKGYGVTGYDNPAALNLHKLALHFYKARAHGQDHPIQKEEKEAGEEAVFIPKRISKRETCERPGWWWWWGKTVYTYGCARCPIGYDCLGMCGNDCDCWSWVCGTCCYYQGCYDHDICCGIEYFSIGCLLPITFTCDSYTC